MKIKTLVLTLENSLDRQRHIEVEFGSREFSFFKVTTPEFVPYEGYSLEETGCAIAHLDMLGTVLETDVDFLIVMEDDVTLEDRYDELISNLDEIEAVTNFDVLLLSTRTYNSYGQRIYKKTGKENQKLNAHNYFLAESMADYVGTHSYVVSKKAFNKFYDLRKQNKIAADSWAVFISLGLRVFHSFPHVTDVNRSFESTIGHHAPQIAYPDERER